jgi:predicted DNA-binding transcriptional regulator AlpA
VQQETDLLLLSEVSALTRVPTETLTFWRRLKNGRGPKLFRVGGRVVAYRSDVDEWVREQFRKEHSTTAANEGIAGQETDGEA